MGHAFSRLFCCVLGENERLPNELEVPLNEESELAETDHEERTTDHDESWSDVPRAPLINEEFRLVTERTYYAESGSRDDHEELGRDQEWIRNAQVTTNPQPEHRFVLPRHARQVCTPVPCTQHCDDTEREDDNIAMTSAEAASNSQAVSPQQATLMSIITDSDPQTNSFQQRTWPAPVKPLHYDTFDHNGGTLCSKDGDLRLTIPRGAIKIGDLVKLSVSVSLHGPFVLPSTCQADLTSPYYWIGVSRSYQFRKPIDVEFEHFGACDPSHYQLLCCEDDDESYIMQPVNYELNFSVRGDILLCKFQSCHFCSYCLFHACKDPVINRIGAFFLKPQKFSDQFTVEVWFSFPISHCLKRNEELYTKKGMELDEECSCIFEASSDKSGTTYFALSYNYRQGSDSWLMYHSRFKDIQTKEVNFYNDITNIQDLIAKEEKSLFPPRFIVNVRKKSTSTCCEDLDINITVTLCKADSDVRKSTEFNLFVSSSATTNDIMKCNRPPTIGCQCNKSIPSLRELQNYSKKIALNWTRIATQLGIQEYNIDIIDKNHPNDIQGKCDDMFKIWLQTTTSACWCQFIQALYTVGLNKVANEATMHLKNDDSTTAISEGGKSSMKNEEDTLNLCQLLRHLKKIPDRDLHFFILSLFPKNVALHIIKDIRANGGSREDKLSTICEAFMNEKDRSWIKVYEALKEAECYNLAEIIKTCFLPI